MNGQLIPDFRDTKTNQAMIKLNRVHHIAIICSDYGKSKNFYIDILGFKVEIEYPKFPEQLEFTANKKIATFAKKYS
jgi:catechol-2,3-dioxygenase